MERAEIRTPLSEDELNGLERRILKDLDLLGEGVPRVYSCRPVEGSPGMFDVFDEQGHLVAGLVNQTRLSEPLETRSLADNLSSLRRDFNALLDQGKRRDFLAIIGFYSLLASPAFITHPITYLTVAHAFPELKNAILCSLSVMSVSAMVSTVSFGVVNRYWKKRERDVSVLRKTFS